MWPPPSWRPATGPKAATKSWVWALVSLETRLSGLEPGKALWKTTLRPLGVMSVSTEMPVPPVVVVPTAWERSVVVPRYGVAQVNVGAVGGAAVLLLEIWHEVGGHAVKESRTGHCR